MTLIRGTLFHKRPSEGCTSVYVLVEVAGTRLYGCRLAMPVNMYGSVSLWGQLAKQHLTSPLPGLGEKMSFKIYLVLALTERSCTMCSAVGDSA